MLNLKKPADVTMLRGLIADADVLVQNFRPGTLERSDLGYDAVHALNPKLIYCSITGFGNEGPYRDYPGYDTVGQGMSGLLSLLTEMNDPKPMGISLSDHLSGIFACYGVMAALLARNRTGRGQHVETSLLESSIAFLAENAANYFEGGRGVPSRATRTHQAQVFTFVASDAKPFVIHLSSPPKFWQGLLAATGAQQFATDERFAKRPDRVKNYDALNAALTAIFAGKPRSEWLDLLRKNDVPCGPLNDFQEVFDDPQVQLLGLKRTLPHPKRGSVTVVGSPVRLSDTPVTIASAAPELGADTERYLGKRSPA